MDIEELEKKLKEMGYDREDSFSSEIHNHTVMEGDYSQKSINHTIARDCKMNRANFDYAAATGSIYEKCKFINCSMHQADYEFCTFYDCEFTAKKKVISSFNNCDFIESRFENIRFESCTFTGAYFENSTFDNVQIINSTLENALFRDCFFTDMDLRCLNMDYVNIVNPKMKNVVLPFSQIPYMFGCLQYLKNTIDSVRISAPDGNSLSAQEYIHNAIPTLLRYWDAKRKDTVEFNFPLANVHIALGNSAKAAESLQNGLTSAVASYDFRMIKFYCKLIAESDQFDLNAVYKFYNLINRLGTVREMKTPQMRSFMRNIGEIKATLFARIKKPVLDIQFRTNFHFNNADKVSVILGRLFSITKMRHSIYPNLVEVTLSENSPLLISLHISGQEQNILFLLPILLRIANITQDEIDVLVPTNNNIIQLAALSQAADDVFLQVDELTAECRSIGAALSLVEYYLLNCYSCEPLGIQSFYCNHQDSSDKWKMPLLRD